MLTLNYWSILFLKKPHHLRGTLHFTTIYKAIQLCLQKGTQFCLQKKKGTIEKAQNKI